MVKMPPWPTPLFPNHINFGLERIRALLKELGDPHKHIPPTIHITGTNGKGSTLSFIRSILEHSGYKLHTYTSPHLIRFNERIKIAGVEISDNEINELASMCKKAESRLTQPVSFFEGVTAMAFLAYKNTYADFTLLEVGMGGRLDATNVVENTIASVVTPISYDHTQQLGQTLAQIAFEKAGILRKNTKAIISMQTDEASNVLNNQAELLNAPVYEYEYDFGCEKLDGQFIYKDNKGEVYFPLPSLLGDHQIINATTAIATIKNLDIKNVTDDKIASAIQNTYWPGRLEQLKKGRVVQSLPSGLELWMDGAHNDSGAQILANWCSVNNDQPIYLICGMTKGRDSNNFLSYFKNIVDLVIGVRVENESMSYLGDYITKAALNLGIKSVSLDSIEDGIEYIVNNFSNGKILVCGSLYLAGELMVKNNSHEYIVK
ncbi:MAG: bifunctional folylpolyglutamate synthase/dihydrofolate synthase [Alphaproteobacteria bacterium]